MRPSRVDYDRVADKYDRRYARQKYVGLRDAILSFLGPDRLDAILDVGCGTGHWLALMAESARIVAGVDRSSQMLARARAAAPTSALVRAEAERPPFRSGAFDRIVCVNALHHFAERERFFEEARRMLRPGGGLMTIGLDPHANRDQWWVYDYFPETLDIDRARFWPARIIRGELVKTGFAWSESGEIEQLESCRPLRDVFPDGAIDRAFTSQLMLLDDAAFTRGQERIRQAETDAAARGSSLELAADLHLFATTAWTSSER